MLLDWSSLDLLVWRQLFAAVATSLALKFLVVPTTFLWRLSPAGWSVPFKNCQEQTKLGCGGEFRFCNFVLMVSGVRHQRRWQKNTSLFRCNLLTLPPFLDNQSVALESLK